MTFVAAQKFRTHGKVYLSGTFCFAWTDSQALFSRTWIALQYILKQTCSVVPYTTSNFCSKVTSHFLRLKFQLCQREFKGRRHRHLEGWSEAVHSFIVHLTLVLQATPYMYNIYVCIKNHYYVWKWTEQT